MDREAARLLNEWTAQEYRATMSEMSLSRVMGQFHPTQQPEYRYVKVRSIGMREDSEGHGAPNLGKATDAVVGLFSAGVSFSLVYVGNGRQVSLYLGAPNVKQLSILVRVLGCANVSLSLDGPRPQEVSVYEYSAIPNVRIGSHLGLVKGSPLTLGMGGGLEEMPIDRVVHGMAGRNWTLQLFAAPEGTVATLRRQKMWLDRKTRVSAVTEVTYSDSDNVEATSYHQRYADCERYAEVVDSFCDQSRESSMVGEWCVSVNFSATAEHDARLLGGLLIAAFHGNGGEPEQLHAILRTDGIPCPLTDGWEYEQTAFLGDAAPLPRYATLLSSRELAAWATLPSIDTAGLAVRSMAGFDVCRDSAGDLSLGGILDGDRPTGVDYSLPSDELNRHALVVGLTGSGKTNTLKCLLHSLATQRGLPFMVIEPAKREYWELWRMGIDDLQVYSVGSTESHTHTLCINPFERATVAGPDGRLHAVPIQTHIDFVYAAFKASFIMYTPMPYVLERAIYEIYEDCGWNIQSDTNTRGEDIYPTIEDLYFKIPQVVAAMGYDQKMRRDLVGSLQARVNSLRIGSKGATLNVARSFPFDELLRGRVVVELEDIGDDDAKAFVISLLLVNLLEVRRQQDDLQLGLRHLMLVEEAHRLLKNVQGGTGEDADPRGAAVEFFTSLLAELRSKGQGFVVADQIPSKLAPDLVKNTNLKVAHRIVAVDERELMGGSMHMREDQVEALASLQQGIAAVYSEGDNRPKLVRPAYAASLELPGRRGAGRTAVLAATSRNCVAVAGNPDYRSLTGLKCETCRRCNPHCHKQPEDVLARLRDPRLFDRLATQLDPALTGSMRAGNINHNIVHMLDASEPGWGERATTERCCVLACLLERWQRSERDERVLTSEFMRRFPPTRDRRGA